MQSILIVRFSAVGAFAAALFLGACSSAPADEATQDVTSESALSSCGHRVGNGPLIGEGPNACVPGTKDFTTAACAHPNSRRVRTCDSNCRFGSFGTCECTPTSCAGRICGDDGCGGSCGACPGYQSCNAQGTQCLGSITGSSGAGAGGGGGAVGSCLGKSCGPDGAGGSCGLCPGGTTCNARNVRGAALRRECRRLLQGQHVLQRQLLRGSEPGGAGDLCGVQAEHDRRVLLEGQPVL
jgi:hypothetical protein